MPIRVNPQHDLGPCLLTLDSITKITELVGKEYPVTSLRATDDIWEVYDEPKDEFLKAVADRDCLDEFIIEGETTATSGSSQKTTVKFICNREEAKLILEGAPDQLRSFEHFKGDIKSLILSPTFGQRLGIERRRVGRLDVVLSLVAITSLSIGALTGPATYCRIVIKQSPPSAFWENIKANLIASLIWFVLGVLALLVAQWIFNQFKIDVTPWD